MRIANSAKKALDLAVQFRPDLLISSWCLPTEPDGLELAKAMRAVPVFRVLQRPFDAAQVLDTVREVDASFLVAHLTLRS